MLYNLINIIFSLLGFSLQLTKSITINNIKIQLYTPFLHILKKMNFFFKLFKKVFDSILGFCLSNTIFIYIAYVILSFFNFGINIFDLLLKKLKKADINNNNLFLYFLYQKLFLIVLNKKTLFCKFVSIFLDSTKFIFWFYNVFGSRRHWMERDEAIIAISHFVVYNFTLAYLINLFFFLIYLIVKVPVFKKVFLLTKQRSAFLVSLVELIRFFVFSIASFFVIKGEYPNSIVFFSKAVETSVGGFPYEEPRDFVLPSGYTDISFTDLIEISKIYV